MGVNVQSSPPIALGETPPYFLSVSGCRGEDLRLRGDGLESGRGGEEGYWTGPKGLAPLLRVKTVGLLPRPSPCYPCHTRPLGSGPPRPLTKDGEGRHSCRVVGDPEPEGSVSYFVSLLGYSGAHGLRCKRTPPVSQSITMESPFPSLTHPTPPFAQPARPHLRSRRDPLTPQPTTRPVGISGPSRTCAEDSRRRHAVACRTGTIAKPPSTGTGGSTGKEPRNTGPDSTRRPSCRPKCTRSLPRSDPPNRLSTPLGIHSRPHHAPPEVSGSHGTRKGTSPPDAAVTSPTLPQPRNPQSPVTLRHTRREGFPTFRRRVVCVPGTSETISLLFSVEGDLFLSGRKGWPCGVDRGCVRRERGPTEGSGRHPQ